MPLSSTSTPCLFQRSHFSSGHLRSASSCSRVFGQEMEEELRCPNCKVFFVNPVLLPCSHSLCLSCAVDTQSNKPSCYSNVTTPDSGSISSADACSVFAGSETESDRISVLSDNDSGVLSSASRPPSYVSSALQANTGYWLVCPVCQKKCHLGDQGAQGLFRNRTLANVILRYCSKQSATSCKLSALCQLCDSAQCQMATVHCTQCNVSYCDGCLEKCHPSRGPLAKHQLKAIVTSLMTSLPGQIDNCKCREHSSQILTQYCFHCRWPLCQHCLGAEEKQHAGHDVQALGHVCKLQKAQLSHMLQALSEKAKTATVDIACLKQLNDEVQSNSADIGALVVEQCDRLIAAIQRSKDALLRRAAQDQEQKNCLLKEQIASCTNLMQKTNGLVEFCIEALKEVDAVSFVQVSSALINRVEAMQSAWEKQLSLDASGKVSAEFNFTLDTSKVLKCIEQLDFVQLKRPSAPTFVPNQCSAENDLATIMWKPTDDSMIDGYVMEIGTADNRFKEVYVGPDTVCTVGNLSFGCIYQARVKAFNYLGDSDYSTPIHLQTAEAAWFQYDLDTSPTDVLIEDDSLTCTSLEYRVVLGTVGFSEGCHYWEVVLDKCDANADVVVGVAAKNVERKRMLGKDNQGWSMYIDDQRSWYLHGETHHSRVEKGISPGSVVGVLLDCNNRTLQFSVNGQRQTSQFAFKNLPQTVLYPAFAVNRNVQISLRSGICIPHFDSMEICGGENGR